MSMTLDSANLIAVTDYYAAFGETVWSSRSESTLRAAFEKPAIFGGTNCFEPPRVALPQLHYPASRRAVAYSSSKSRWMRQTAAHAFDYGECEPAARMAMALGARGPVMSPVAACATGAHAIATGAQLINDGYADCVLAGAEELGLPALVLAGYRKLGALSQQGVMRPFDRRRDGFVPAQGLGWLLLERADAARERGATIIAYLSGYSLMPDPHSMTAMTPSGESIARAIESAVKMAGVSAIDYVNAHGTATRLNDVVETRSIALALGESTPVSSTKPLTGHLLGAAGAVEAVICLQAMRENYAPPTLHLEEFDGECNLDYLPLQGRAMPIKSTLSLNYGFGGHIGVLVWSKAD